MDFHNPKVQRAMVEHIRFADRMVSQALGEVPDDTGGMAKDMVAGLRHQMVICVLQWTLSKDWKLGNTLVELRQQDLPPGKLLEDCTL